jgi:hypothetical protein
MASTNTNYSRQKFAMNSKSSAILLLFANLVLSDTSESRDQHDTEMLVINDVGAELDAGYSCGVVVRASRPRVPRIR